MPFRAPTPPLYRLLCSGALLLWLHAPVQAASIDIVGPIARSIGNGETMGCEQITLSAADAARYFRTATAVTPRRFHDESVILPCSFSGRLMRDGKSFHWSIHAGGAGYLHGEDGRQDLRFLCHAACEKAVPALMGF